MSGLASQTVAAFGSSIGLDELTFDENGLVCLEIEQAGTLYLEQREKERQILVYLARTMPVHQDQWLEKALECCHFKHRHEKDMFCGVKDGNILFFLVKFAENAFVLTELNEVLDLLMKQHNFVTEGN